MKLSEIAALVEEVSPYPLVGVRCDGVYIMVDIGAPNTAGHVGPTVPFVMAVGQADPEYVRILVAETAEKLRRVVALTPAWG